MNVALGVSGGIAAYKAAELTRALMEYGFRVDVIMTRAAQEFIQPLTFAALTGRRVATGIFPVSGDVLESAMEHIRLAQENQLLVIAPATADVLAKLAHGMADDLLTTTYLAFTGKVIIAPAMNTNMWNHTATQANLKSLRERGHVIVEPDSGELACGMVGPGRLAEPPRIAAAVLAASASKQDLAGETVLITAGPTREPIDGVRYISNRSSGKMGYAIAEQAALRGAIVILISGPVRLETPQGVTRVDVESAVEMREAVMDHLEAATIVIKAAAVADYYVANAAATKIKKTQARLTLDLEPTPDILAELGTKKGDRLLIGFAAETDNLVNEARRKLNAKNCDMVVGNLVTPPAMNSQARGFDADENEVVLVTRMGDTIAVERAPKRVIADRILNEIPRLRLAAHAKA